LAKIKAAFSKFANYTLSGIWRFLKRLKISYKRGRLHITSPDKRYREINLIWDCWSCHYHPDVLLAAHRAGITLIPLPTYAPWENPIEKLWRWLCQEVLHMSVHEVTVLFMTVLMPGVLSGNGCLIF